MRSWLGTVGLIAGRDLRIERRSRVALNQVLPFAAIVMVMFGFAIDDTGLMQRIAPGLIVLATLFGLLVLVQRAFAIETEDGALDALRTAGVDAVGAVLGQDAGPRRPARRARGGAARARRRSSTAARSARRACSCWSRPGWPLPSGWPPLVRSTAASLPAHGGGRRCSRCCCCRWWRPF